MHENQPLAIIRDTDPVLYKQVQANLERELALIESKILDCPVLLDSLPFKVDHWVLMGIITHSFSKTILYQIAVKYKKIGMVPQGYFYPELYSTCED